MGSSKFINQEYKCIILWVWLTTAWQQISPQVIVNGLKKYCVSIAVLETGDDTRIVEW